MDHTFQVKATWLSNDWWITEDPGLFQASKNCYISISPMEISCMNSRQFLYRTKENIYNHTFSSPSPGGHRPIMSIIDYIHSMHTQHGVQYGERVWFNYLKDKWKPLWNIPWCKPDTRFTISEPNNGPSIHWPWAYQLELPQCWLGRPNRSVLFMRPQMECDQIPQ